MQNTLSWIPSWWISLRDIKHHFCLLRKCSQEVLFEETFLTLIQTWRCVQKRVVPTWATKVITLPFRTILWPLKIKGIPFNFLKSQSKMAYEECDSQETWAIDQISKIGYMPNLIRRSEEMELWLHWTIRIIKVRKEGEIVQLPRISLLYPTRYENKTNSLWLIQKRWVDQTSFPNSPRLWILNWDSLTFKVRGKDILKSSFYHTRKRLYHQKFNKDQLKGILFKKDLKHKI